MSLTLKTILGQVNNISFLVNENFDRLKNAVLLKDGSEPMQGNLDMNLNEIINVLSMSFKPGGTLDLTQTDVLISDASKNNNPASFGQLLEERNQRIAADDAERQQTIEDVNNEREGRVAGDASLQDQLTGEVPLAASAFSEISWHGQVIQNSVTIPDNMNAWSFGPTMTIASGQEVTIGTNSFWTIANGQVQ